MQKKFNPSRVNEIVAKARAGCSETASYAVSRFKSLFQSQTASEPRQDPLQKLIIEIVGKNPEISEKELFRELQNQKDENVIQDITADDIIKFWSPEGKSGEAPVSGLKDRLTRAKAFLKKNSR